MAALGAFEIRSDKGKDDKKGSKEENKGDSLESEGKLKDRRTEKWKGTRESVKRWERKEDRKGRGKSAVCVCMYV